MSEIHSDTLLFDPQRAAEAAAFPQTAAGEGFPEAVLRLFCRPTDAPPYRNGTLRTNAATALSFLRKTVTGFDELVRNRRVLDYGCGLGWQACVMASEGGAEHVTGIDIVPAHIASASRKAEESGVASRTAFRLAGGHSGRYEVIVSCSSFEHFDNPEARLAEMKELLEPGGRIVLSWAEPFYSPYGAHMGHFTKLPWISLLFPESAVFRVRRDYTPDGKMNYVDAGVNRMTVSRYLKIVERAGMQIEYQRLFGVKGLPLGYADSGSP